MNLNDLHTKVCCLVGEHPQHKDELINLYQMAVEEVQMGESETNECELAYRDMIEVIGK